jgi:L,D-transpeptidase catalytic domain
MKKIIILILSLILLSFRTIDSNDIYDELQLSEIGLSKEAFELAYSGYQKILEEGKIENKDYLTICDFTQPSTSPRLYVINLRDCKVSLRTWVAHGKKSGEEYAYKFSNKLHSHASSIGFYLTDNTYFGKRGLSLRIDGLDTGYNDNARKRSVVIHGSYYIGENLHGRSLGCPAVPRKDIESLIQMIKGKSLFFIYYPDESYLKKSTYLI